MPRKSRISIIGVPEHVIQRGNNRQVILRNGVRVNLKKPKLRLTPALLLTALIPNWLQEMGSESI